MRDLATNICFTNTLLFFSHRWLYNLDGDEGILPKFKKDTKKRNKKPKIEHVPTFEEEEKTDRVLTFEEEEALVLQEMEAGEG